MCKRFTCAVVLVLVLSLAGGAWADLVGHWTLNEGTGTGVTDLSGNGITGNFVGQPKWVNGRFGGALELDGASAVNFGDPPKAKITGSTPMSIALWIYPNELAPALLTDRAFLCRTNNYAFKASGPYARFTTPGGHDYNGMNTVLKVGEWQHVGVTFDPPAPSVAVFYLNGIETDRVTWATAATLGYPAAAATSTGPLLLGNSQWSGQFYKGRFDNVRLYDHLLTLREVMTAMKGEGLELASLPNPATKTTEVLADGALAWQAGQFAATHDVYLGTSFADVNAADGTNPAGVLVSQGQAGAQYDPPGLLPYGQTYYWRVDEVNAAPSGTIFKGDIWSFTVEVYSYPVVPIAATASTFQPGMDPNKTIDGSGLTGDLHDAEAAAMWLSTGVGTNWIQYEFAKVYKLDRLQVWNSNQKLESLLGFGAKQVTIEASTDGTTWTAVPDVPQFNRAPGAAGYAANTTVSLGGVEARFVKLTITANWGGMVPSAGLAEVRFFYVPVWAFGPQPADAATDVGVEAAMNWRPGREATSHTVYLGTDPNAVANGTATAKTVANHGYVPDSLSLGTTYYWKVDEVGAATYPGDVWSFTTQPYQVVEDFESYTDQVGNAVYEIWLDGSIDKSTGSIVGLFPDPINGTYCETTIIHGGKQSMPLAYDNTAKPYYSEATLNFAAPRDWTAHGIKSLSLWFRGAAGNTGQLYVKVNGAKVLYDGEATDLAAATWQPWNIDLSQAGNVGSVRSLVIGIEGTGATGTLYFDDIRLYPKTPEVIMPVPPDQANLVARYTFDGDFRDSAGSHHGTPFGDARITTDPVRGQVLMTDGNADGVDIAYSPDLNPAAFTVSLWAYADPAGTSHRSPLTSRDDAPQRGYILYITPTNTWQFWTGTGTGWNTTGSPAAVLGEWTHVAASFVNGQKTLYLNGRQVAQNTGTISFNTQQPLRIGAGASEGPGNYFWRGFIDEVRLYNRDLSAAQVAGLAGRTKPLYNPF